MHTLHKAASSHISLEYQSAAWSLKHTSVTLATIVKQGQTSERQIFGSCRTIVWWSRENYDSNRLVSLNNINSTVDSSGGWRSNTFSIQCCGQLTCASDIHRVRVSFRMCSYWETEERGKCSFVSAAYLSTQSRDASRACLGRGRSGDLRNSPSERRKWIESFQCQKGFWKVSVFSVAIF